MTASRAAPSTLFDVVRARAEDMSDKVAFTFLKDGERPEQQITYGALDRRAAALAARLHELGARGQRVLLVYPAGIDYIVGFFGCVYAGAVAVPVYPPRQNAHLARIARIASDAQAAFALSNTAGVSRLKEDSAGLFAGMTLVDTTLVDGTLSDATQAGQDACSWNGPGVRADELVLLQYTSGSTGDPKGVMLSHANLLHNSSVIARAVADQGDAPSGVSWLPLYHDMGLIGGMLQPLYMGYHCALMSPAAFLQRPVRWLRAISDFRASISAAPDFAYELCARRIKDAEASGLNLSHWRAALSGAETVRSATLNRFAERFGSAGFHHTAFLPCYGLAEATLMVSGAKRTPQPAVIAVSARALAQHRAQPSDGDDARELVGCGLAGVDTEIRIVDPVSLQSCDDGAVGEVWVRGPGVAAGYWNKPETTAHCFGAQVADRAESGFLRTGDLGFLRDGELFVTGRSKDLIVLRGRNHYPQDIEASVKDAAPELAHGCAVFSVPAAAEGAEDGERVVAVIEVAKGRSPSRAALEVIAQRVGMEHELSVSEFVWVEAGVIPRTSSGKLQRSACRSQYLAGELSVLQGELPLQLPIESDEYLQNEPVPGGQGDVETWLVQWLAQRVGMSPGAIDVDLPLAAYAPDSLSAVELAHALEARFGLSLPLNVLLGGDPIRKLLQEAERAQPIPASPPASKLPLSYGQQRLCFIWQLDPASHTYNVFDAYRVSGPLDVALLKRCVESLIARHEILRCRYLAGSEGFGLQILASDTLDYALVEADEAHLDALLAAETRRPFDLENGPLLRLCVLRLAADRHVVLLTLHHIAADGWSAQLLLGELSETYAAGMENRVPVLPAQRLQYRDFAAWQATWLTERQQRELDYWRARLAGAATVLQLATDKPRPAVQGLAGDKRSRVLPPALVVALQRLGQAHGATLFMVFLAGLQALLHRYTGQHNVLVGTPISGRHRAGLESIVGFFVNTLVMRADFTAGQSFDALLEQVRDGVLQAYGHQDLPFHRIVEELRIERDTSRSPLFQVSYTYHNLKNAELTLPGLASERVEIDNNTTNFDLGFSMREHADGIECTLRYKTDLFEAASMERMLEHFENLLTAASQNPQAHVTRLPLLGAQERRCVLQDWNRTSTSFADSRFIHQAFEDQAARTPDAPALIFEGRRWSYTELDANANRLAHHLQSLGVGAEVRVGVAMERSLELVLSLLAVLKAGAAYVPIDPHYPAQRIAYMLDDSQLAVLLTHSALRADLPEVTATLLAVDEVLPSLAGLPATTPHVALSSDNLAYVIYTSGSTGRPKGAMNTHGAILNRLQWMQAAYGLSPADRVLQKTPFSFDVSVWEFFWPLMTGAALVIAKPRGHMDPDYLCRLIGQESVSTVHFVPSMLQAFLASSQLELCRPLKRAICSGEALAPDLQARFFERMSAELHNLYGPTEAAVDVTAHACQPSERRVPIGKPIANIAMYVLDAELAPTPIGVPGELHIGGVGLARGYLGRPDLSAEKFIPHPFAAKPGERLYKTGDLARHLADGSIEYLGRIDEQVKVRGFRIELGEIEAALNAHPAVKEAVAFVRGHQSGDARLAAAVVPDWQACKSGSGLWDELQAAQVEQWQDLYEDQYAPANVATHSATADAARDVAAAQDGHFNIVTWNSSYTGEPIPAEEMHRWVDHTVERVRALGGSRLLEIGCGTGLILFRVAPHCERYVASDFSAAALRHVSAHLDAGLRSKVALSQRRADDFGGVSAGSVDTIVINSVAQYFPDQEYLEQVLEGAIAATAQGGKLFIGDLRHLALLRLFHASVQRHQATAETTLGQLRQRVKRQVELEKELLLDPRFFFALQARHPRIGRVEVLLKEGGFDNELSRFRYDVVLHLDEPAQHVSTVWLDWRGEKLSLEKLAARLAAGSDATLCLRDIPNGRLAAELAAERAAASLADEHPLADVQLEPHDGVSPEALRELARRHGYRVALSWAGSDATGSFQAAFVRHDVQEFEPDFAGLNAPAAAEAANRPLRGQLAQRLPAELNKFLALRLPEHMLPAGYHVLGAIPLSANGKVDRRSLEQLGVEQAPAQTYVAPRSHVEEGIAAMWCEVMGLARVGIHDHFFELGGHSLLLTQIASRIRTTFQIEVPLLTLFDAPTVAAMAAVVEAQLERDHADVLDQMIDELEGLSPEQIQRLLEEEDPLTN